MQCTVILYNDVKKKYLKEDEYTNKKTKKQNSDYLLHNTFGWDVTTHQARHQSYHIFITIITLTNNKSKKEKKNREPNGSRAEK